MKLKKKNKVETITTEENTRSYNNLDEVMNKNRPFNIIYSGVEQESYFNILYDMGIRNFLMSFHYLQNRHISMEKQYGGMGIKFFIDSGAHTYQNDPKYAEYDVEYWEKHLQKYLRWVEKNRDYIFAIASFDFENIVGADVVKRWNEEYFEPFMLRTGIPVCFVWHQNSHQTWEYYCKRYPYVGFSSVNTEGVSIELQEYMEKLKVAENNNALVHGFGMTRTSMLTQLPFYTADSTTWLVGLQYGEINYWTGSKMTRLKKDKWKGVMLPKLLAKGFDEQKLLEEDVEELVKVNVQAFIEAEEYVQDKLKSRMYWLKADSVKRTSLEDIKYPSLEWLNSDIPQDDWKEYAQSFNVSQEDKQTAINCITDITMFMNWDKEELKEYRDEVYNEELVKLLHDTWINRIVSSNEERIEDLKKFYSEVLLGTETKLLYLGTNFDKVVKEREEYIDDTEYEYEDVPKMVLDNMLSKYLPKSEDGSAPEIDELDDEIFEENDIIPIRDENGRFLKGQRQVMKPKKLYSNKYPKLACDTCFNAQKCPEYKAGYACAYNKMFDRFNTRDMGDIIQAMQGIVDFNLGRLQRAMFTEMLNGGMIDPNVSQLMNQNMGFLNQLKQMYEYGNTEVLKQTKITRSDGTEETTTQVSNPQRGGILETLFKNMGTSEEQKEETPKEETVVVEQEEQ